MNEKFKENKTNINRFPGHMKKTIDKINESLKIVDFVIEIIDARIPLSSINNYVEKFIKRKPILYILNKADLADENKTKLWLEYFSKNGNKAISVNLKNQKDYNIVFEKMNEFCKEKNEKYMKKGLKNLSTRAMVVGIPNVGKSTFINYVARKKIALSANTPGFTKSVRWIKINNLELMDTPGILQPQFEDENKAINLALTGSIKEQVLPILDLSNYCLDYLKKNYPNELISRYNLEEITSENHKILEKIGFSRGFLNKNGEIDYEKAASILLNEFKNGIITRYTLDEIK